MSGLIEKDFQLLEGLLEQLNGEEIKFDNEKQKANLIRQVEEQISRRKANLKKYHDQCDHFQKRYPGGKYPEDVRGFFDLCVSIFGEPPKETK